jgi:hypothetical protein
MVAIADRRGSGEFEHSAQFREGAGAVAETVLRFPSSSAKDCSQPAGENNGS